jgi:2-oxoglutarate ferredoxin oxidoreductase subunit alpha
MEGISYMAGAELPGLILNVVRGGPGLGTIQPSQADYFQATKGGGHGDYRLIVLAPSSVQEMFDFVSLSFDLSFKYRNPVMMLSDGVIGQMMEKVELSEPVPRRSTEELIKQCPWATTGKPKTRERNIITSLNLDSAVQERHNHHLQAKYREIEENEVRFEEFQCEDAEYLYIAYGSSSRIAQKSVQLARAKGIKAGLLRPITLFPFPKKRIAELADKVKGMLTIEMSAGQMVEDVRLAVNGKIPVDHYGRMGGMIPSPEEVVNALEKRLIGG